MEIFKLLKANIKHKKGAFKSIIALTAIIVFSFTATVSNNDNIDRSLVRSHSYAATPTFNSFANKRDLQDNITEEVAKHPQVTSVTETECILADNVKADGEKLSQSFVMYRESKDIYRVFNDNFTAYIENPEPLKEGEIYVPYGMTAVSDIKIGSVINLGADDNPESFTVKGFIEEPLLGASVFGTKRLFISDSDFERIYANTDDIYFGKASDIGVNLAEGADYTTVKKEINDMCGLMDSSYISIPKAETATYTKMYSDIGSKILLAFLVLLVAIVIISIWHSISTSIEMEYINLGILKSQGFTSVKIRLVYILQYLIAEISIIFAAVVISMICSKAFIKERTDIGIFKALGFTAKGLRTQFAIRFMIIAIIGSVLGGIASFFLTSPLLVAILRMVGLTQLDANISFITFIIPAAAISLSFFIFAYLAARKINTVEVRELISE